MEKRCNLGKLALQVEYGPRIIGQDGQDGPAWIDAEKRRKKDRKKSNSDWPKKRLTSRQGWLVNVTKGTRVKVTRKRGEDYPQRERCNGSD